jgi:hypothetical protein
MAGRGAFLISDSFNRADSSSSLGNADTGQAWTALRGTWGISSNQAYNFSGTGDGTAALETGMTDIRVTATCAVRDNGTGVIARAVDADNYYTLVNVLNSNALRLYAKVSGGFTLLAADVPGALGDVIALECVGSAIKAYKNGAVVVSVTNTALTSGTKAGIRTDTSSGRLEDFSVVAAP